MQRAFEVLILQGFSAAAGKMSSCTPVEALQVREEGRDPSTKEVPEVLVSCCLEFLTLLQGRMGMQVRPVQRACQSALS